MLTSTVFIKNGVVRVLMAVIAALTLCSVPIVNADDYHIGSGDLLHVAVFDHAELTMDVRVSQTGNISLPLVGQLQVEGKSPHELEQLLSYQLSNGGFLRQPQVSINVVEFQSQKVGVMGQVAHPGQYALTKSQRVLDLLAQAGGVLSDSAADDITLVRADGSKATIDAQRLFEGQPDANLNVLSGDMVFVPRASQFYVYGEVQRPGAYKLSRNLTVSQAISLGGGLTARGTERRAVVKRRDAQGKEHKVSVSGLDLLRPDDVLLIKESLF